MLLSQIISIASIIINNFIGFIIINYKAKYKANRQFQIKTANTKIG